MNRVLVFSFFAISVAACYAPTFNETTCGVNDTCPAGFECIDGVCRHDGAPSDAPTTATLTVMPGGAGGGTITSAPAGIDCGAICTDRFALGTQITLTAVPAAGSSFTGWNGGGCTGTGPCTITLAADTTVNADFAAVTHTVTVAVGGNGTGMVTSVPSGITCPGACTTTVPPGTWMTLTAAPGTGAVFLGWSDGCTGTGTCTIMVTDDVAVNASFGLNSSLVVTRTGTGAGTVTSSPAGINCGTDCDEVYGAGTMVTLTAAAATNSTFNGWTGGGCTGTGTCTVTISQAVMVAADFTLGRHTLTASRAGPGGGTITSSPAGINCGADCTEQFNHGTAVTLTAIPDGVSLFTGWSGACTGTGSCVVTMDMARSVTATFAQQTAGLNVVRNGSGSGTVTSSPAGINCGADCSETFALGTVVTLTATPTPGTSTFTGWSGAGCSGTGTCVITFGEATTVTATFALVQHPLTVMRSGAGSGNVTSSPAGINCGTDCSEVYAAGTMVTLTASATANSTFIGWTGGGCTGTGTCTVTISQAVAVTADFTPLRHTLTAATGGDGGGSITSNPAGINCGADCTELYDHGTMVTLTATPNFGSAFYSWFGACSGSGSCVVTMDQARAVTAAFAQLSATLDVVRAGNGSGTVTSSPAGINCGADCSEGFAVGSTVTLTATPATGTSTFTGWSGAGCSGTGTCVITISDTADTVTATFALIQPTLTVSRSGNGTGTVSSTPAGISCGNDCTESYAAGTTVTLSATAASTPLSQDSTFAGWSGGGCSGTGTCTVTLNAATTVTATFTLDPNYAFVTSTTHTGNLGGLAGADAICQARASAAGLPGTYRAWLSSDTTSAASRIGTASGWIRPDGEPFALSQADLYTGRVIYPLRLSETGVDLGRQLFWSASYTNGEINDVGTCTNWTSAAAALMSWTGSSSALGDAWTDAWTWMDCSSQARLTCFGVDRAALMPPLPAVAGRRIFVSNQGITPSNGIAAADAICNSEAAAAGLPGTYRALLATTTASAASRVNATGTFVRPDNAIVAVGNALFTAAFWDTAINVTASGFHAGHSAAWTGASSPTALGTVASTCNNWSSSAENGTVGRVYESDARRAFADGSGPCTQNFQVYCVQL